MIDLLVAEKKGLKKQIAAYENLHRFSYAAHQVTKHLMFARNVLFSSLRASGEQLLERGDEFGHVLTVGRGFVSCLRTTIRQQEIR